MADHRLNLNEVPRFITYINPRSFDAEKLTLAECQRAINLAQVRLRGWYFPHINDRERPRVGKDGAYVFQTTEARSVSDHVEEWRLYRSGQFMFKGMVWEHTNDDFQKRARNGARHWDRLVDPNTIPGFLEFRMMIALVTEAYTFAGRLAQAARYDESANIEVGFRGVMGYGLASNDFGIDLYDPYPVQFDNPRFEIEIAIQDLIAEPRALARTAVAKLFELFGWFDPAPQMIEQHQRSLLGPE